MFSKWIAIAATLVAVTYVVSGATFFHPFMSDSSRVRLNGSLTDILDYTNRSFNCPFAIGSPSNYTYNVFFTNVCGFPIGTRSCCTNYELDEVIPALITKYSTNMNLNCIQQITKAICAQCLPTAKRYTSFISSTGTYYFRVCKDQCWSIFKSCRTFDNGTYVGLTYDQFCVKPRGVLGYPSEISTRSNNYSFEGNFTGIGEPCWSGSSMISRTVLIFTMLVSMTMIILMNY
jgi:hypothetical protein